MYSKNEISFTESCNTTQKCVAIQYCPKLYDEKVALETAGSITTVTAGDPEKEKKMKAELNDQKCPNHEKEDYFCCDDPSDTDQKPKYGNLQPFLVNYK